MDARTARALAALNNRFYAAHAESFSRTRSSAWKGWQRCLDTVQEETGTVRLDVLDVAAGNLRFERFLAQAAPELGTQTVAVDACAPLARTADMPAGTRFVEHDVLGALLGSEKPGENCADDTRLPSGASLLGTPGATFDLVACFGFMHHVPGARNRARLLAALVDAARPGGIVAVSFWRFLDDERLSAKAHAATERAAHRRELAELTQGFEEGDAFLGWQEENDTWRYCHSLSDGEIDGLAASVAERAEVCARYRADGATGRLNTYLVLKRHAGGEKRPLIPRART